jgi:tRNA U54 and U55 pseudouridine synthase Pus10
MRREEVKDELVDKAKKVLDDEMTHREKMEKKALDSEDSKEEGEWNKQEIEFLKNNRTEMSNEELEEFFLEEKFETDWKPFSRTEERYILESFGTTETEQIAEALNRDVEQLEKKIKMMGLDVEQIK